MSNKPMDINVFDETKITFKPATKIQKGTSVVGHMFYLQYDGRYFPNIVLPNLKSQRIKVLENPDGNTSYKILFSFEGKDEDTPRGERLRSALSKLHAINERILDLIMETARAPGGKAIFHPREKTADRETIKKRYKGLTWTFTREEDGSVMPDSMYCKIIRDRDTPTVFRTVKGLPFMIDSANKPITVTPDNIESIITRGSIVKPVVQGMSIFVAGKDSEITNSWGFFHGRRVYQSPKEEYIMPEEEDGLEGLDRNVRTVDIAKDDSSDDSDEEEEEDEMDEEAQLAARSK